MNNTSMTTATNSALKYILESSQRRDMVLEHLTAAPATYSHLELALSVLFDRVDFKLKTEGSAYLLLLRVITDARQLRAAPKLKPPTMNKVPKILFWRPLHAGNISAWLRDLIYYPADCWQDLRMKYEAAALFLTTSPRSLLAAGQVYRIFDELQVPSYEPPTVAEQLDYYKSLRNPRPTIIDYAAQTEKLALLYPIITNHTPITIRFEAEWIEYISEFMSLEAANSQLTMVNPHQALN